MKINGKLIAEKLKENFRKRTTSLKNQGIIPHLAIVLLGNDPSSVIYVKQKEKVGKELGVRITKYTPGVLHNGHPWGGEIRKELIKLVTKLNNDPSVHGIIIQRPLPIDIDKDELNRIVIPQKDVDGFHPESLFTPPVALAVIKILEWVFKSVKDTSGVLRSDSREVEELRKNFIEWLKKKQILIIGRGETAGVPIAKTLKKMGLAPQIAHSKTDHLKELCLKSDIIISCVGKAKNILRQHGGVAKYFPIVRHQFVTSSTILIGVGLHQENGKLATDYDQDEIAKKVAYYTPVPGGVGPVNVACLFENLAQATSR